MIRKHSRRKAKPDYIKDKRFEDRNISPLESHQRVGKTLKSPFSMLPGNVAMRSWSDECIPNILWACILSSFLDRTCYLDLFRGLIINARENVERRKETFITHNYLAAMTEIEFDTVFADVLAYEGAKRGLSAMRLVECLPDRSHWERNVEEPNPEDGWKILARAVGSTFDHQSQRATDIRWLKIMYLIIVREGMVFGSQQAELIEELRLYPSKGDMRLVRPMIRSMEMATRQFEFGEEISQDATSGSPSSPPQTSLPEPHKDAFWAEMRAKTRCFSLEDDKNPQTGSRELCEEILQIYQNLAEHFHITTATTAPDPRHDGAFGLTLYATSLLGNTAIGYSHNFAEGRIILRSIMEAFVTLHYLTIKDDPQLWLQYRRYGSGQVKLALLKNLREEDVPDFVDLTLLDQLANEDMWMEFQDIKIGNWADLNLRKMAEEAVVKDVYDKYYDWSSGYAHGHWTCVRDAVLVTCLNPLHRFHRIPAPPNSSMPTILIDGSKLVNRMIDDLNHLYPTFKQRLTRHKSDDLVKGSSLSVSDE